MNEPQNQTNTKEDQSELTAVVRWETEAPLPKDRQLLLDIGTPWPVVGAWNSSFEKWCFANFNVQHRGDGFDDVYWETDVIDHNTIIAWCYMPELIKRDGWTLGAIRKCQELTKSPSSL